MNDEITFEEETFEYEPEAGDAMEFGDQEAETAVAAGPKVPHPQFGMVTPLSQEFGDMETYESADLSEAGGKVPHPQFGLVTPLGRQGETTEDFESMDESEGEEELAYEAVDEEILGGDERYRVSRTTVKPCRWICYLEMRFPGFLATGTGLLISPRHVLTCSHNLFLPRTRTPAVSVHVTPGCNGVGNRPFGRHLAASWRITDEFRNTGSARHDFALITLRTPIGNQRQRKLAGRPLGYWSKTSSGTTILLTRPGEPRLRGKRATLGGYPGDKPDGEQWGAKGQIVSTTPAAGRELFYYTMDSCAGHSGSPVWIRRGTKIGLVGIHTGSCIPGTDCREVGPSKCRNTPTRRETTSNRAVLITPQLWTRVRGWM